MNRAIKDHQMTTTITDTALPLHLFTVEEYHRMAEAGLFEGQRVELIHGKIVDMSPSKSNHAGVIAKLIKLLSAGLTDQYLLNVQNPIHINKDSEPEPDLMVLHFRKDYYVDAHPTPKETVLLIEVSDSSLEKDQKVKLPLYAKAGIPEVWIVNLQDHQLEQYREPSEQGYSSIRILRSKDVLENEVIGSMEVEKVLGE
jgi:Uma2 family endonuclease